MLKSFEINVFVWLMIQPAYKKRVEYEEEKNEKDYARILIFFCKNSRRLRDASTLKTVSKERNKIEAKIVSMISMIHLFFYDGLKNQLTTGKQK